MVLLELAVVMLLWIPVFDVGWFLIFDFLFELFLAVHLEKCNKMLASFGLVPGFRSALKRR